MQACPYDAIYIDPETNTAAKCHFCAHRTEVGLEPACVVVCPEHAIVAGDMADPGSEISRLLATQQVHVRKPEQGTSPKLFYISAEEVAIVPNLAAQDQGRIWSDWPDHGQGDWRGPIQIGNGRMAEAMVQSNGKGPRESYNTPHKIPWHWQVPAYLTTKAIGAGSFIVAAVSLAFGVLPQVSLFTSVAAFIALLFIGLTTALLVWDLDRPERFWTILIRPQWRSWLARGAFILIGFSLVGGLFFLGHALNFPDLANWLIWPGVILAVLSAIYTAFLFAQAEGRDLWQSPLLPWHLLVQSVMAGAASLLVAGLLFDPGSGSVPIMGWILVASLAANLFITVAGEFGIPHASQVAAIAAHLITHGKYRNIYRFSLAAGLILPLGLAALVLANPGLPAAQLLLALAGALSIAGLFAYEWVFVMAPQDVPNN
jgi:formate-dependent nitrite reductase membrane component NrfD